MTPFVTLEQVKDHLRIDLDDTAADNDLTLKLEAASERIGIHLNGIPPFQPVLDSLGQPERDGDGQIVYTTDVRSTVKSATLLLVSYLCRSSRRRTSSRSTCRARSWAWSSTYVDA